MPIMDKELLFCESMSIAAAAAASTIATNVVYLPQVKDHKGSDVNNTINNTQRMCLNCVVEDEDMLAAVDGSVVTFELYNDTDAVPTTGGDVIITKAITENTPSEHPDGTQLFSIPLPLGKLKPYFGLKIGVATQELSTGKITAWIGPATQQE